MARQQDPAPRAARLTALATVAILAMVAAFAFGRVFQGRAPTLELMAAALVSVALAAASERRSLLLSTLLSAVGLLWAIGVIVFPHSLWYGLPSKETLTAIGHALRLVGEQAKVQVAPTLPLPPLMLAALTALWTASFSAYALALRAGSPLLAILPPIALVGFADTVLEDGVRPVYAIAFLGAALAVVFVDGLRRIRQWGPMWSGSRSRRLAKTMDRGARGVALLAVATAVFVPGLLPGFRSQALVDFSSTGDDGARFDPFVSIKAQLTSTDPVDLFRVTSENGPSYWRMFTLDHFNGTDWTSSDPRLETAPSIPSPAELDTHIPSGATALPQRYQILAGLQNNMYLPMASMPETVSLPSGELRWDADLATAGIPGGLPDGYEYSVTSRVVAPTAEQLNAVPRPARTDFPRFTSVPGDVSPEVARLAEQWTADASTPYQQVMALQEHFTTTGGFQYSLDVEPTADADELLRFLTQTRKGFCQQFATAMAIMVRELGLPARVVVGFRQGTPNGTTYTVNSHDAHSWVEVLFAGYGWLPFEPTPRITNPIAQPGTYLNPSAPVDSSSGGAQGEQGAGGGKDAATCLGANGRPLPGQLCNADPLLTPGRGDRGGRGAGGSIGDLPTSDVGGYHVPYLKAFGVLLGLAFVLALVLPIAKASRRRRSLRRARGPRELVLATYRVFDSGAGDLGLGRREGETPQEYRERLSESVHFSDGHLAALTAAAVRAAYSPIEPDSGEADDATRAAKTAIRDMRRDAGIVRRIAGIYRSGW
jgi:transglutaminase-like putative cysteine protease